MIEGFKIPNVTFKVREGDTAENQEKYSRQIAKNTGGLPSDVSVNPTSTSRGRNAGRSGR